MAPDVIGKGREICHITKLPNETFDQIFTYVQPSEYPDLYLDNLQSNGLNPYTYSIKPGYENLIFDLESLSMIEEDDQTLVTMVTDLAKRQLACSGTLHIYGNFGFDSLDEWLCLKTALQNPRSRLRKLVLSDPAVDETPMANSDRPNSLHPGTLCDDLARGIPLLSGIVYSVVSARGTAPFTKLTLYNFSGAAENLTAMIRWLERLEAFTMTGQSLLYPPGDQPQWPI
ncbi:hypothetical protein QBC38DRAFT_455349 [Podospora fimiseda]|uniref:Uncharacterized protein n=1 Tax=Podospora fimiseda TaxID=252190 RepID=A0AAN7H2P7_9PEZI|nr:hypothetical protein QBC38DRAFT_455349 [Podospora fimiseda]